jgi:hypothetical protein
MLRADPVYLARTGDCALRLDGPSLAASATTKGPGHDTRWHEVSVWEAESLGPRRLILQIEYRTCWDGETGHDLAEVLERGQLRERLRAYDPLAHVVGYPSGEQFKPKQDRLRADLKDRWEHAVSEVLEVMSVWELAGEPPPCASGRLDTGPGRATEQEEG